MYSYFKLGLSFAWHLAAISESDMVLVHLWRGTPIPSSLHLADIANVDMSCSRANFPVSSKPAELFLQRCALILRVWMFRPLRWQKMVALFKLVGASYISGILHEKVEDRLSESECEAQYSPHHIHFDPIN
ncbi:hypothetical protein BD779DRAFT_919328 [Infundibulicybe gibba]|nr:hypothetical protein BD779DRAFT_919328 [Infundibulicybe gibba]